MLKLTPKDNKFSSEDLQKVMLRMLQEASTLNLADVKKGMLKDKHASLIFKKDLSLDDIDDVSSFLSSIKYYLLNNDNVIKFVKSRNNIKDIDTSYLTSVRKMRAEAFNKSEFDHLKQFVADLFREYKTVSNGTMSSDLKKEISKWVNKNGSYFNLSHWAQKELQSLPSIKPTKKVVLYRGVLFSEHSLEANISNYDGTLTYGNGAEFLKSIRNNNRTVDLSWSRPSSWTTDKNVAKQFAMYGAASSQTSAMFQWFDRTKKEKYIDGALGYVISTFADPDDILIDMNMMSASIHSSHGNESEVILAPGKYLCRIVNKYTVNGEVDPNEKKSSSDEKNTLITKAAEDIAEFISTFNFPIETVRYTYSSDGSQILRDEHFNMLILNSTTTTAIHGLDKLLEFYKKHLSLIQEDDLLTSSSDDADIVRSMIGLKKLIKTYRTKEEHSKFKDTNKKSSGPLHDLTAEEIRKNYNYGGLDYLESSLLTRDTIANDISAGALETIGNILDIKMPAKHTLQSMGQAKQSVIVNNVLNKFFEKIKVDQPDGRHEAIKTMINLLRKANRNNSVIYFINNIYNMMEQVNA